MPAIINHKVCDEESANLGAEICPMGAFYYDEKTGRMEIDPSKCISCGACVAMCPEGAIVMAEDEEELKKLKKEFDENPENKDDK